MAVANLDGLHAALSFLAGLESHRANLSDGLGRRLLVNNGALLGLHVLHHIELVSGAPSLAFVGSHCGEALVESRSAGIKATLAEPLEMFGRTL